MIWNRHLELLETSPHSVMSASQNAWTNDSDEQFLERYKNFSAKEHGTFLHAKAAEDIKFGISEGIFRPANGKTYETYVNDAIHYRMEVEQPLVYNPYKETEPVAYATCDAISFRRNLLRIHDLKTGKTPAKMKQLEVYAAYFCLEYNHKPGLINMEFRIYQNDTIFVMNKKNDPEIVEDVARVMDQIKRKTEVIYKYLHMEEI